MSISRLSALILAIILLASCQQTQTTAGKPVDQNTFVNQNTLSDTSSPTISDQETEETPSSQPPLTTIKSSATSCAPSNTSNATGDATPETDQKKIDQALELCNYAQDMWEEGNLEEALANLDSAYYLILEIDHHAAPELSQQKEDVRYLISKRILEIYASRQIVVTGRHKEITITLNTHVQKEIKRLTGPERKFFTRALERSYRYRPYIVQELKKAGLPDEISWLPLIESGFKIRALSPARALGLWQFIPSTGHKFGLSRNYYIDERMDPEKATQAAIAYLKELHNLFGDWTTALAAYNCGEYRVLKTIRRQKINYLDNFWDLYQSLPRETARYVPRFLATVHIINNLEKYGIKASSPDAPIAYKSFDIKKQVRLKDIAREINTSEKLLKTLNPELRHALLPPETYSLKVPEANAELFLAKLDKIKSTYTPPPMYVYHRVRRGDTLSGIAKRYRTSVRAIKNCNNIRSHRIIAGKVLKIPSKNYTANSAVAKRTPAAKIPPGKTITYKVRRGDNLWLIAKRFSTTTKQIKSQNKLSGTTLHIGQKLTISSGSRASASKGTSTYRVKSGDSPFLIAKRHNMTLNRLLALNQLSKRSKIYPGQKLLVE
ncbi:MAG: LysM peptidoglycan-binding domain-containing protein [Desulfobacterales bacterium]|nr:LysM peptidoglycan-binding domain-containing protein [Desulfobacterales bacterium]